MKLHQGVALLVCSQLAWAADINSTFSTGEKGPIQKRLDYNVCHSDCSLHGVAFPDINTLQLPLEDFFSERCPQTYIGRYHKPTATSNVCLDFSGQFLTFTFAPFSGYTTKLAKVHWKLAGNLLYPNLYSSPPPDHTIECEPEHNGDFVCKVSFVDILGISGSADLKHLLHGMCPNGDREGLNLYLAFSGTVVVPAYPHKEIHFQQEYPCQPGARDRFRQCTSFNHHYNYIQVSYRCSKCDVTPCPSSSEFGTAYGYQSPRTSFDLATQHGKDCSQSWGWYETPSLKVLKSGINGLLYVRTKTDYFQEVGLWHAYTDSYDKVKVKYSITPGLPYTIDQVNVDLACLKINSCNPESFIYNAKWLGDVTEYELSDIKYPKCPPRSKPYLIVSAVINTFATNNHASGPADMAEILYID
ncbi:hypothetical protein QBC43DRAFT_286138 [Cladorrhinum sp. PSN259]|nr:hypothetical protein QBC43DRAFT_286138 [Cladorrhinum sp. PSN259]